MQVRKNALLRQASGYRLRWVGVLATLLMTLLTVVGNYASPAWAQTFTVTNLNDSGPGSLREAIEAANANAGADEIVFADGLSGTITLASTLPPVTDKAGLIIDGGGDVTVSGNDAVQVFVIFAGDEGEVALTLRNLTIANGHDPCCAGGILNDGTLKIINSTISGNSAVLTGGGISNGGFGTLKVVNSTISGNSVEATGGGILNDGTLKVVNSTISGNSSDFGSGGGIYNEGPFATTTIARSTISDNNSPNGSGGGIYNENLVKVTNSTIADNSVRGRGGGVFNSRTFTSLGIGRVINSTISGNSAGEGGGIYNEVPPDDPIFNPFMTLRNTIVANSPRGGNCFGDTTTDGGYNIDDGSTCGFSPETGSLPNTNPLLDPEGLQDNGGPTPTIALLPQSPAVDLVGQDACPPPSTDQRGVERPQGEACDSGAFELVQGPQTKTDCKNGGWEEFGFKNQGQCIASLQRNAEATQ